MENKNIVRGVCVIISGGALLVFPLFGLAYSDDTTHPALTQETVKFFNKSFPELAISNEKMEFVIRGIIEEDNAPRWMKHFYDPVYNRGLIFGISWMSSKNWAQDTMAQAGLNHRAFAGTLKSYFGGADDYSWERAIYEYAWGDKNRGLETLGHVLHLLQDATVPDHTRNDPHPPLLDMGSPYEHWTAQFARDNVEIHIAQEKPAVFSNINNYFDTVATYSNNNFFSEDRIFSEEYVKPVEEFTKNEEVKPGVFLKYGFNRVDGLNNHLVLYSPEFLWKEVDQNKKYTLDDEKILTDYWTRLSKVAVTHGAGAMKLFFDEVAHEKETRALYEKNRSWLGKKMDALTSMVFKTADLFYGISVEQKDVTGIKEPAQIAAAIQNQELSPSPEDSSPTPSESEMSREEAPAPSPQSPAPTPESVFPKTRFPENPVSESNQQETQEPADISTFQNVSVQSISTSQDKLPLQNISIQSGQKSEIKIFTPSNTSYFVPIAGGGASVPRNDSASSQESNTQAKSPPQPQTENIQDTTPPDPPTLTSPTQWHASTTEITFSGTAEANSIINTNFSNATTSASAQGVWSLLAANFPQGTTTVQFFAKDAAGNVSTSTEKSIFIDSQAPDATLAIDTCGSSLASGSCVIATTTLYLRWSAASDDFTHYEIICETGGTPCANFSFSQTTATSTTYQAPNADAAYTFKARTADSFGNRGAEAAKTVEIIIHPIVINEIAWAGTSASRSADEYIELYNPTAHSINLSGMTLTSLTDTGGPNIALSGTLAPRAYHLIERTDDSTVSDITASTTASFGNGLSNNGEVLALKLPDGTIIDKTPALNTCGGGWCAGVAGGQYLSMERYDPHSSGEDKENWASGAGPLSSGKNADGIAINGSPGRRNTASYLLSPYGTFLERSKTLAKDSSPYVIGSSFGIGQDKTLTIEPGVVIKMFSGVSLSVDGIMKAEGSAENPIIFTSIRDDTYGGDTNKDGATTTPAKGDWGSIALRNDGSTVKHAVIRYGGKRDASGVTWGNIRAEHASPTITNSTIELSETYGAWFKHASSTFEENIVRNNNASANQDSTGLLVENGKVRIAKNTFDNNYYGLRISASDGNATHEITVSENTFVNNAGYPAQINRAYAIFSGNTASGNGTNGINVEGSPVREGYRFSSDIPYVVTSTGLSVPKGKTLTVSPGAIIKLDKGNILINGTLDARGASGQKIIFTSIHDDEYGGNTNATSTQPSAGDWESMTLAGSGASSSTLDYVLIRYGGAKSAFSPMGALRIDTSSPAIKNATIEKNYRAGVWIKNGTPSVSDAALRDHREPPLPEQSYGMFLTGTSRPTLANILFKNNRSALFSDGAASVAIGGGIAFEGNDATTTPANLLE